MTRDLRQYLYGHEAFFSAFDEAIIYYDEGQRNLSSMLSVVFENAPFRSLFHSNVKPDHYRLLQVADFVSTVRLLESKWQNHTITAFESAFIDEWHFRNIYLRALNKKELR